MADLTPPLLIFLPLYLSLFSPFVFGRSFCTHPSQSTFRLLSRRTCHVPATMLSLTPPSSPQLYTLLNFSPSYLSLTPFTYGRARFASAPRFLQLFLQFTNRIHDTIDVFDFSPPLPLPPNHHTRSLQPLPRFIFLGLALLPSLTVHHVQGVQDMLSYLTPPSVTQKHKPSPPLPRPVPLFLLPTRRSRSSSTTPSTALFTVAIHVARCSGHTVVSDLTLRHTEA